MKTTTTFKQLAFAALLVLGIASCKKDKKGEEPAPPQPVVAMTITELKALSTSASVTIPDLKKISGTVISDAAGKNIDSKAIIIQEATGKPGIVLAFDAAPGFAIGDNIEVNVSKQTLAKVNGEVMIQNVPKANATKQGSVGNTIAPRTATTAEIITNAAAWDGTLVTLPAGTFSGGNSKYSGMLSYTDNAGTVKSNVVTGAAFESTAYPAAVKALTGIVRVDGTEVRLDLRNAADATNADGFFFTEDWAGADAHFYSGFLKPSNPYLESNMPFKWDITQSLGWAKIKNVGANDADKSFLTAGKNYFVVMPATLEDNFNADPLELNYLLWNAQDNNDYYFMWKYVKTITVTFAGSYMGTQDLKLDESSGYTGFNLGNFDATKNSYRVALSGYDANKGGYANIAESPVYHDQGVWHTVTLKVPDGVDILNQSKFLSVTGAKQGTYTQFGGVGLAGTPVVIEKIVLGFEKDPKNRQD